MGKSPFLMGKSQFLMGKSTISMAIFHMSAEERRLVPSLAAGVDPDLAARLPRGVFVGHGHGQGLEMHL